MHTNESSILRESGKLPICVPRARFTLACVLLCALSGPGLAQDEQPVDFQRQIRPIFAEHCLQCHGPDHGARQADLRLDLRDVAIATRDSGRGVITPGKPGQSELLRRVTSNDPDVMMPPPDQRNALNGDQIALLRRWIKDGAPYSGHWAFTVPQRPMLPDAVPDAVIHNGIDRFVAHRLLRNRQGLAPPAEPGVLCRRIHLDIIGLPPSTDELDEFIEAAEKDLRVAVVALLDELLASEHFGEKWARHWLDVARYADSNGYEKDLRREQWAWRDWVIQAINDDMPYDRFIIEQIAGDLLENPTQQQRVANGFLRNSMLNEEGAIIPEQFRMEAMFDRMDCLGKAVLGLSIQCAQCHSHKFDPISQDEYYGMFAFLNDTCEAQSTVYTPEQQLKIAEIQAAIGKVNERVKVGRPVWERELRAWEDEQLAAAPVWDVIDPVETEWPGGVNHPAELLDHSVIVLGHPTNKGEIQVRAEPAIQGVTGLRVEALTSADLPLGGPGFSGLGMFALTELIVETRTPGTDAWEKLPIGDVSADFSEQEQPVVSISGAKIEEKDKGRVGPVAFLIDGDDTTAWRSGRGTGRRNAPSVAVIRFAEPVTLPEGTQLQIRLIHKQSASGDRRDGTVLGRSRFSLTTSSEPHAPACDHAATLVMQKPARLRTADEQAIVFDAWRRSAAEFNELNAEIDALWKEFPEPATTVMNIVSRPADLHRPTFLLDRGVWDKRKHEVKPHVPAALHPLALAAGRLTRRDQEGVNQQAAPTGQDSRAGQETRPTVHDAHPTRLDFARWLVSRQSPLTARVQVNRVWQAIFGAGLVETPEDFGTRAPQPEYLNLLDWLSVEFMDGDWSTKQLIRTIITSATYQQSSRATAELLTLDPRNRLLARGPRFRADAELVRDIALTASGLVNLSVGGPSTFPPVPDTVLSDTFTKPDYWKVPEGPERYRRGLYIFRKRSMPDPVLTSFDAPNADFACARRVRSNTPLASLVTLNEPIFVEAARGMARRVLREGGSTDGQRVDYAFRLCTGRRPGPAERTELLALLQSRRERLTDRNAMINEITTGDADKAPELPDNTTAVNVAAWTITARVLLNLDEILTKN